MLTIVQAVTSKYPTNKAFGITLSQTRIAIEELGGSCEIWASSKQESSEQNLLPYGYCKSYYRIIEIGQKSKLKSIRFLSYATHTFVVAISVSRRLRNRKIDLIVIREAPLFILVRFFSRRSKILLELHHVPKFLQLNAVKLCLCFRNTEIATISPYLKKQFVRILPASQIHLLPMASPDYFRATASAPLMTRNSLLYYGKLKSSGFDNGVISFLSDLDLMPKIPKNTLVGIVGFSKTEQDLVREKISPLNYQLEFREHVPHDRLPEIIKEFKIGIIPYPFLRYHNERFPIKAVELAAMGMPLLCSDLPGLQEILPKESVEWYSVENKESLFRGLQNLLSEIPSLSKIRRANLRKWSEPFTYNARAKNLMEIAGQGRLYEKN